MNIFAKIAAFFATIWASLFGLGVGTPYTTEQIIEDINVPGFYVLVNEDLAGEEVQVDIMLNVNGNSVSGVAARVYVETEGARIRYVDADPSKPGVQAQVSSSLTRRGFSYPVNSSSISDTSSYFDISTIHVSTDAFKPTEDLLIATIAFKKPIATGERIAIWFNEELTKAVTKEGQEIEVAYAGFAYGASE